MGAKIIKKRETAKKRARNLYKNLRQHPGAPPHSRSEGNTPPPTPPLKGAGGSAANPCVRMARLRVPVGSLFVLVCAEMRQIRK